jgi:ribosomal protein S18 acetylase RimI-like enzyme
MMDVRIITLDEALPVRHRVLWPDKPLSFCTVEGDESSIHYGVFLHNDLVCVGSTFINNRTARLRKFATLEEFQGRGAGTQLISHIVGEIIQADVETFWCDARSTAVGFYKKFGMEVRGDEFIRSGISYYKMEVKLS